MTKLFGKGINDADYPITIIVNGKRETCPIYKRWRGILARCYDRNFLLTRPSYKGCKVAKEWLKFSNFRNWMLQQNWQGLELDKDLVVKNNKIYSPETCLFVEARVNGFLKDRAAARGKYPIGVYETDRGLFKARCNNPFTKKSEFLGNFKCPEQGHLAWKAKKHEFACQLADMQSDSRVAEALRKYYKD